MYKTIDISEFRDAFRDCGRGDNFSYEGLEILFDYLEDCDNNTELDVIVLCCEFEEASLEYINMQYSQEFEDIAAAADWLMDQTSVCGTTENSVIYAQF